MAALAYGSLLDIHDTAKQSLEPPAAVLYKAIPQPTRPPTDHELRDLQWGTCLNGPLAKASSSHRTTPGLEQPELIDNEAHGEQAVMLQSWNRPSINKWRFFSACALSLGNGMNDGVQGALIPYIEQSYHIGYAVVSLIFVAQAAGFVLAAPLTHLIDSKLGRARAYMLGIVLMIITYTTIICRPPYGLFVFVYLLNGVGIALNLAINQVFVVNLVNSAALLGVLHGSYGIGATIAPLIGTSLISSGVRWSFYYFIPLALQAICFVSAGWSFWNYEEPRATHLLPATEERSHHVVQRQNPTKRQLLKQAIREKTTLLGSLFIFSYQGSEVSISGWVITFLIKYRNGDPGSVGYVTAGFWAGITVGRFVLSHPAHRLGEKTAVVVLTVGAAAFELLVWFVPNVIGNSVALAIVGLLLGPVYPCASVVFGRLLNQNIQMSSFSFIMAMGSSGGAVAPFVTGLMAQKLGTWILHPICLFLFLSMVIAWISLPRLQKRTD